MIKKLLMTLFMLITTSTTISCSKVDKEIILWEGENYFEYPQYIINRFYIDDEGYMYYLETDLDSPDSIPLLRKVDFNGNEITSFKVDTIPIGGPFIISNNKLYFTIINEYHTAGDSYSTTLYNYNIDTQSTQKLYEFINYSRIDKLEILNNKIYIIGIDNSKLNKEYKLVSENDSFKYSGEVLISYDLENNTVNELPIDFPITFSKTTDSNIMIYSHDDEKGYYFAKYNIKDGSLSDKTYHDLGLLTDFSIYNQNYDFAYSNGTTKHVLQASSVSSERGISELMPDVAFGGSEIICKGGYTFYLNFFSNKVERIKTSAFLKNNNEINILYTRFFKYEPFSCGYMVNRHKVEDETFAVSVLSQEKSYDLYLLDSREVFSENIKNKGAFYPLNKVDGVNEYLDECFPYIKNTATTAEGDIWMLPFSIDVPCLIYNEKICSENSFDLSNDINYETFLHKVVDLKDNSDLQNKLDISGYVISENFFYQYLKSHNNFDSSLFRNIIDYLYKNINHITDNDKWRFNFQILDRLNKGKSDDFLFTFIYDYYTQTAFPTNDLRASKMPLLTDNTKVIATGSYLCVNPKSKNLQETLEYISELCHYLLEHNQTMLFKDRNLYPDTPYYDDLYAIYSDAEINFTPPADVYDSDFTKYMSGDITLETLIKEANRKLDIYRNE
jgi:hypothetical protein